MPKLLKGGANQLLQLFAYDLAGKTVAIGVFVSLHEWSGSTVTAVAIKPKASSKRPGDRHSLYEPLVASAWAKALGRSEIDKDADFRACRLNANRALEAIRIIWMKLGYELPANCFLEFPTVRRLAEAMDSGKARACPDLYVLRDGDPAEPLFMFGGGGGYLLDLVDLAAAITYPGIIYGVPAGGMDGRSDVLSDFAAEAKRSADIICRYQPEGPYRLLGYSMGGTIALEVARRLGGRGHQVGYLGFLDTGMNDHLWPLGLWAKVMWQITFQDLKASVRKRLKQALKGDVSAPPPQSMMAKLNPPRRGNRIGFRFRDPDGPNYPYYSAAWEADHTPRYSRVREGAARMLGRYQPELYNGVAHFYVASNRHAGCHPKRLWEEHLPRAIWQEVPGSHHTMILARNAKIVGALITDALAPNKTPSKSPS